MRATLWQGYIVILPALLVERGHQRAAQALAVPVGTAARRGAACSASATL